MSNASSNPRSSIDRADAHAYLPAEPTSISKNPSRTPTRLQHSPSLPNIWFPSQSGPSATSEMSKMEKSSSYRPSAPPSPRVKPVDDVVDKDVRPRHVKYASLGPARPERSVSTLKTHARRRTERDQPHSLLTPPLTPSSSIRTTASDSTSADAKQIPDSEEGECGEEISDPEQEDTRILLLGNINRQISVDALKGVITEILLAAIAEHRASDDIIKTLAAHSFLPDEFLKGINDRHLSSKGIIPVVFFDVRVAKLARELLTARDFGRLEACIGKETDDNGQRRGLSGRLVALEELTETLGYSPFLDSIDGQFTLAVQEVKHTHSTDDVAPASEEDTKLESKSSSHSREGINFLTIHNLLKSIGSVRSFKFHRRHEDKDGTISLFYNVEYYDSREASMACKDLSNQTIFGMKFSAFRKVGSPASFHQSNTVSGDIPFPNISTAGESFSGLAFGTAGFKSNIRQRFNFPAELPAKECDFQEVTYQNPNTIAGGAPSPRFFYNTPYVNAPSHTPYPQDALHIAGPPGNHAPGIPPQNVFRLQAPNGQWESDVIYRSDSISPCYNPDGACWYCPSSRGTVNNPIYSPYAIPCPTPTPGYYPAHSTPMPGMVNAPLSPHPPLFSYEYMDPLQPVPGATAWGVDPAIAAVGPGPSAFVPIVGMNVPSPAPYYIREETLPTPRAYSGVFVRQAPDFSLPQSHVVERELRPSVSPPPFAHISTPESESPASHQSNSLVQYEVQTSTRANPATSGQCERNQLNLAKIEEGVDTRTTVMIKNIPNKMSDTDLTAYIGKVCPRRIDFLYLRMDFKNGCNVGYAFVNFIGVEDLLHFAKERLGAKWNMFSSEKVLQMSYANYQGKEALIEKFKNSAIMDEREAWRPRIFYSFGKDQGLPEPFPAPTHIRRKERSSFNRGTLFPPGANAHNTHYTHGILNNTHRRYADDHRIAQHRSGDRLPAHLREGRSSESGDSRQGGPVDKTPVYRNSTFRGTR